LLTPVNVAGWGFRYPQLLMPTFKLELEKLPSSTENLAVYQPKGRLSLETVTESMQSLRGDAAAHMVLDMSGISFLDSAGVGALVSLYVNRRSHGKTFALAALTPQGNAVVTVAGLQKLLPIHKTLEEALAEKS
jgi:anti-sigma B factor antagonist